MFPITAQNADGARIWLREPTAREELGEWGRSAEGASRLLCALGCEASVFGATLCTRDALVAQLMGACFGDSVRASANCDECDEALEISFSLRDYVDGRRTMNDSATGVGAGTHVGTWVTASGVVFRLPTVADELETAGMDKAEAIRQLRERCIFADAERDGEAGDLEEVETAMAQVGPLLSGVISTRCFACESEQTIEFNLPAFFIEALRSERSIVLREIHCLARAYGWSYAELLQLTRSSRRALVDLVAAELEQAQERSA